MFHDDQELSTSLGSGLSAVFGQSLVGVLHRSLSGELLTVNERFCTILGRNADELRRLKVSEYTHPDDISLDAALHYEGIKGGAPFQVEKRYTRPDGTVVWCEVSASFVEASRYSDGSVVVLAQDITARKEAVAALKQSEQLYRGILEASADCIGIISLDGRVEFLNGPGLRALEISHLDDIVGQKWADGFPEQSRQIIEDSLISARGGRAARFSSFCPTRSGVSKWWDILVTPMGDDNGHAERILSISRDITAQREATGKLLWASEHDSLTSLANRRAFEGRLQASVIRSMNSGSQLGLLLLDLDYFKNLNDTLGHDAGDALLITIADRIKAFARPEDFVARLGGDEFAILIEGTDEQHLLQRGEDLLSCLRPSFSYSDRRIHISASIGAALFPTGAASAVELLKNADIAMYASKNSGRSATKLFVNEMRKELQTSTAKLDLARVVLAENTFQPYYQPKVCLTSGKIEGLEALLRWHLPGSGMQTPDTVSEAFSDCELATKIGDHIQERVLRDVKEWASRGLQPGIVAINAAPAEFLRDDFAERLLHKIDLLGVCASRLEVEVTEHVFIERGSAYVARALRMLSDKGVRIALDDFGTGHSSLSHLRDFPVNVLKIDRSFVERMTIDRDAGAIVSGVISLANSLRINVVAEGVETEEQRIALLNYGCKLGQGYLFGRAVSACDVPRLFQDQLQSVGQVS